MYARARPLCVSYSDPIFSLFAPYVVYLCPAVTSEPSRHAWVSMLPMRVSVKIRLVYAHTYG
jgi:hypothetical protein